MTIKTQESTGTLFTIQDHDERLKTVIIDACEENQIPDGIRNEIVENGLHRFIIDKDNNVKSISAWSDLNEYITNYKEQSVKEKKTAVQLADERQTKKQELYDLLCHYSRIGDQKSYRACRAEYAKL